MFCKKCNNEFEVQKGLINYCSIKCRNSHFRSEESKRKTSLSVLSSEKVKESNAKREHKKGDKSPIWIERVEVICSLCNESFIKPITSSRKYHGKCYTKIAGGYKPNSGKGKKGWYKGFWCDSSWELAWVIYHLEHDIEFERNTEKFKYSYKSKELNYIPDFKSDNIYYEIKGYSWDKVKEKINQFPFELKVLFEDDLKEVFKYVKEKYGSDYIKLYEGNPWIQLTNNCKKCNKPCKKKSIFCSKECSGSFNRRFRKIERTKYGPVV